MISHLTALLSALFFVAPVAAKAPDLEQQLTTFASTAKFEGTIVIGNRSRVEAEIAVGPGNRIGKRLPFASITKQIVATMVMRTVATGKVDLDAPASRYLPGLLKSPRPSPTVRELLQHRAGLRNPDTTPLDQGTPSFYTNGPTGLDWCLDQRGAAGGNWNYNNCDFVALAALIEAVERKPFAKILKTRIFDPAKMPHTRLVSANDGAKAFDGAEGNYPLMISRLAGAGGLAGTARDLWAFDRALLAGKLLPETHRATMWQGDPALGYMALGQWSFEVPIKGCAKPVAVIERRGSWGRYQSRNLILPDLGKIIVVLSERGEDSFDFGEIWQGSGFSHDVLSLAACGPRSS